MTDPEAQKIVTMLTASHPNMFVRLSADQQRDTMAAYRSMLRDLEYDVATAAIARLLATLRYMPTAAEIREAALTLTTGEQSTGGEQWGARPVRDQRARRLPHARQGLRVQGPSHGPLRRRARLGGTVQLGERRRRPGQVHRPLRQAGGAGVQERRKQLSEGLGPVKALEARRKAELEVRTGEAAVGIGDLMGKVLRLPSGGES